VRDGVGLGASRRPGGRTTGSPHRGRARQRWMRAGCSSAARAGRGVGRGRDGSLAGRPRSNRVSANWRVRPIHLRPGSADARARGRRCRGSAAVEVVRGLREGPRTRPDATLRLVERRLEEPPALDAATSAVLVQALAVLLAHGTRGGRCRGRPQGHLQAGLGPGAPERRPRGCHHPAASSSLMRLRLRLWVARTDAR
jgi:hypothetical protein